MRMSIKNIRYAVIVMLVAVFPLETLAQWNFDIVSMEAYINDHKQQRSLLLARSTLELSNQLLHEYSSGAAVDYKELNVDLDKYIRAFDVIDILYQSLRTSLNVYSTYNTVSDRIGDYKNLLNDYYTEVMERNKMELHDTLIIGISLRCVQSIAEDGKQLYRSMSDLVLYATGAAACSTSDLLLVLESINQGLDNIEKHLNKAYFETWRYIQLRIGYWKESVYLRKDKSQIANEAFRRWMDSGLNPFNR